MSKKPIDLYRKYLKERENTELISKDHGFITYRFEKEVCYIIDLYILPEFRKSKLGTRLESEVIKIAKENNYDLLLGSVDISANNWKASEEVLLCRGYEYTVTDGNTKYYIKEI